MTNVEKIDIAPTTEQAELLSQADILKIRELWDEGIASGQPAPLDFQELRREARQLLKQLSSG